MRIVIQRSKKSSVTVHGEIIGKIEKGFVLFVGITHEDTLEDVKWCAKKVAGMRIFEDNEGKINLSIKDIGGDILSISQFTLYADCKKGNRPSFMNAAKPDYANSLYATFNKELEDEFKLKVETGVFGADMKVDIYNDGPVTIILDSKSQ